MDLAVGAEDVDGLTLVTAKGAILTGSVISDTGEPFDFRGSQLQISARPGSPDVTGGGMGGRVGEDFSFSLPNLTDAVFVRTSSPQGWTLKSVIVNGQDITDTPVEFPAGQTVSGAQIVMTKKIGALTGQVTDAKGTPVLDATVVVFPANEKLWTYQSRFIKAARPDQEGKYRVTALPGPHDYLVIALQGLEDGQAGDPEFLATVKQLASKVEIGDGESKALDVKLSTPK
jgi:Carboxypeptidase regulatory-like domain